MQYDPMLISVVVIVAALALFSLFLFMGVRRRKAHHLRDRFGTEYDRTVEARGRSAAEKELEKRERMAQSIQIQPLTRDMREAYATDWEHLEARFVERPTTAVMEADELMQDILRKKGYPLRSFDELLSDLAIQQPELVDEFRAAHDIIDRDNPTELTTEELRQAMLHYRTIFDRLVGAVPRFKSSVADTTAPARDTEIPIETVDEVRRPVAEADEVRTSRRRAREDDRPEARPRLR